MVITGSLWRIALTVVFVAAAVSYAALARGAAGGRKASWSLHGLAAAAMVAMLWPVGMVVPPLLYVLFFTACGLFVAFVGMFFGSLVHWPYHAAMMAAMAAMPVVMITPSMPTSMPSMSSVSSMPVMSQHGQHMAMAAGPILVSAAPLWLRASSAALAGLLFLSALWWFYVLVRGPQRPYPDLLMAIGMGTYFALCV